MRAFFLAAAGLVAVIENFPVELADLSMQLIRTTLRVALAERAEIRVIILNIARFGVELQGEGGGQSKQIVAAAGRHLRTNDHRDDDNDGDDADEQYAHCQNISSFYRRLQ